jgi:hypothetical protein
MMFSAENRQLISIERNSKLSEQVVVRPASRRLGVFSTDHCCAQPAHIPHFCCTGRRCWSNARKWAAVIAAWIATIMIYVFSSLYWCEWIGC